MCSGLFALSRKDLYFRYQKKKRGMMISRITSCINFKMGEIFLYEQPRYFRLHDANARGQQGWWTVASEFSWHVELHIGDQATIPTSPISEIRPNGAKLVGFVWGVHLGSACPMENVIARLWLVQRRCPWKILLSMKNICIRLKKETLTMYKWYTDFWWSRNSSIFEILICSVNRNLCS